MLPFNHPFDSKTCADRLYEDYKKHKKLIVAFDFDNTIFDYHNNGGNYSCVIDILKECSSLGFTMILFTSNEDKDRLNWMERYCNHFGINVHFINECSLNDTRKPYYNILLDDRAGLKEAYNILCDVITRIKQDKKNADIKPN